MLRLLSLALLATACSSQVSLVVDLRTDLAPVQEFDSILLERVGERGVAIEPITIPARADRVYVEGVRLAELQVAPGDHVVRVRLSKGGALVVGRSVAVSVTQARQVTVLLPRECGNLTCPGPADPEGYTECVGGRCGEPSCTPQAPESCPVPECESAAECTPQVSCLGAACLDGACFFADDGSCGAGRWCDPALGCVDLPDPPDAGPVLVDAGTGSDAGMQTDAGACVSRTCAELGYECGNPVECGRELDCGGCTLPATCGGGGAAFRCGSTDTTGPTVTITSAPDDPTSASRADFSFIGDDGTGSGVASYECRLDSAAFAPCTSPQRYLSLGEGTHRFRVRALDVAGNVGPEAMHVWRVDRSPPSITIDPIGDPRPTSYTATPNVAFSFTCDDASGCDASSFACRVDGTSVPCTAAGGSVAVGGTGTFAFGGHTLEVDATDAVGNFGTASAMFTVTRCAGDMQYPSRASNGLTRGACCSGLVESSWWDFSFGFWHARGDGSCRPMSDHDARPFEVVWTNCQAGLRTTEAWLQGMGLPGCAGFIARGVCVPSQAEARLYCGTDGGSGSQTPFHGRASEGWHPAPSAGCQSGRMSSSLLMQRAGADNVCFNTVDLAAARNSVSATDGCQAGLTRYCRTNPVEAQVACVCHTSDPYASDGRN